MGRRLRTLGPIVPALALATLVTACSTDQDDPPGIDGPAVVDTSLDVDPSPDTTPPDTTPPDTAPVTEATPTTVDLIDSIDGPVVVGSTP